ncbi:MAG: CotH kinase family protein [Polyangiaceae bacterium]
MQRLLYTTGLLLALASAACSGSEQGMPDEGSGGTAGGKADSTRQLKDDFFGSKSIYLIDIRGWGASTTPATATTSPGAKLGIYRSDVDAATACPSSPKKKDRLHSTQAFTLARSDDAEAQTAKPSLEIAFTDPNERFYDMRALPLSAMASDPSQMREALTLHLLARAKVPAPRQTYVKLCIDGDYRGLFSLIENVDKGFLQEHFDANDEGSLYRGREAPSDLGAADLSLRLPAQGQSPGSAYAGEGAAEGAPGTYQLRSNTGPDNPASYQSYDDLARLVRIVHAADIPGGEVRFNTDAYRESVESIFDVRTFLRWAGVNSLLGGWDNYWARAENYFLYNSGRDGAETEFMSAPYFHFVPWNYVHAFGTDASGVDWARAHVLDFESASPGASSPARPLITLLLRNDSFKAYYLDHLRQFTAKRFTVSEIQDLIDDGAGKGFWPRIARAVALEAPGPNAAAKTGRPFTTASIEAHVFSDESVKALGFDAPAPLAFVAKRQSEVQAQLGALSAEFPAGASQVDFPEGPRALPAELEDTFECPIFDDPVSEGKLDSDALTEASGLAVSRKHPGVVWMHNDSGSAAELFAVGIDGGKDLGQYQLPTATAIDWEDMAIGPGPIEGEHYLYVADTGDIDGSREQVTVYRVPEPDQLLGSGSLSGVTALEFEYPNGKAYDAETLLVDPLTADIYLVSKNPDGKSRVFLASAPHTSGTRLLTEVASLEFGKSPLGGSAKVTAGDIAPYGELIVLRTLDRAYAFRRVPGQSMAEVLQGTPCKLPLHAEPQGEAIGFSPDGLGYFTVSEGAGAWIYTYPRFPTLL